MASSRVIQLNYSLRVAPGRGEAGGGAPPPARQAGANEEAAEGREVDADAGGGARHPGVRRQVAVRIHVDDVGHPGAREPDDDSPVVAYADRAEGVGRDATDAGGDRSGERGVQDRYGPDVVDR